MALRSSAEQHAYDHVTFNSFQVFAAPLKGLATDARMARILESKISHTYWVRSASRFIMGQMGGVIEPEFNNGKREPWNQVMADAIASWHDAGALVEALIDGTVAHVRVRHGVISETAFKRYISNPGSYTDSDDIDEIVAQIDIPIALQAIIQHNEPDFDHSNPYAALVRDADKMGNVDERFRNITVLADSVELYDGIEIDREFLTANKNKLTKDALLDFMEDGFVLNKNVRTISDWILKTIGWRLNLNFETSKKTWDVLGIDGGNPLMEKQLKMLATFNGLNNLLDIVNKLRENGVIVR